MQPLFKQVLNLFKLVTCLLITLSFNQGMAQTGYITGRVTDEAGQPLPGATVERANGNGSVVDEFGRYRMHISTERESITASFVGYQSAQKTITGYPDSTILVNFILQSGSLQLKDVVIITHSDNIIGQVSAMEIRRRPVKTSQELLRFVPSLFIAQHAGGGKAEQIFLRGFDIDHGTDITLSVDGMPVNMVSHAHGQGYSDLHFLIPETVRGIEFNKGPYYSDQGNFNTAGYAAFQTFNSLSRSMVKLEGGQFNSIRAVAMIDILPETKENSDLYIAGEAYLTDGYFDSEQDFSRYNLFGKYAANPGQRDIFTMTASTFRSKWNASGQIPERAVESGDISRFGAIDDTEGGNTSRTNLNATFSRAKTPELTFSHQLYWSHYNFRLFSNFTFFLVDPVNGDQIMQEEDRDMYGYKFSLLRESGNNGIRFTTRTMAGFRFDDIDDSKLFRTSNRTETLEKLAEGNTDELNLFAGMEQSVELNKFVFRGALRLDYIEQHYRDLLSADNDQFQDSDWRLSPKLQIDFTPDERINLFLKTGIGFHSNDTRAVLADPTVSILPKATGLDLGITIKPVPDLLLSATIWMLDLDQEFVYVGDEAIVELSGPTRRTGIDFSVRYQVTSWLYADADVNLTHPRSKDAPEGEDYIPLAPVFTSMGGINVIFQNGINGSLRYRYLGDRSANEDYTVTADGYFLLDATMRYSLKKFEFSITGENLLNVAWKEAQFDTESRLFDEAQPVNEIHFTPGTPFAVRAGISFYF